MRAPRPPTRRRPRRRAASAAGARRGRPRRRSSCSAPGRAATRRRSAPPTSGCSVALVDRGETLGGVCLNVGCIPSKALAARRARARRGRGAERVRRLFRRAGDRHRRDARLEGRRGREADRAASPGWRKQRKVEVVRGDGQLTGPNVITVRTGDGETTVGFEHCIIAAGSSPAWLPDLPDDERIMDSTGALELADVPERLLVIGGGIIGLEMATVYDALGSQVTVVELHGPADPRLRPRPRQAAAQAHRGALRGDPPRHAGRRRDGGRGRADRHALRARTCPRPRPSTASSSRSGGGRTAPGSAPRRRASTVDERGFIAVDRQMRTNVGHIFAIGDVVGEPMLAHKATHEGKVAAEVIAGDDVECDARSIPNVAYTDPEVAWIGLTETQARARGHRVREGVLPVGGLGALSGPGPRRRPDEAARRARDTAAARGRASSAPTPAS